MPPFEGPRGELSFELSDGEPVSFYLEWGRELELTVAQRQQLIEIRRRLRLVNDPFMQRLDSLREAAGVDLTPRRRLTDDDHAALRRFREWSQPTVDTIRVNNDGARAEIRLVLDPGQLARGDSIALAGQEGQRRRRRQ